jgi:hypothetical protein
MKHLDYDIQVMRIIKALREQRSLKHKNLALPLDINRTTYGRIEKGKIAFTPGQLRIMAKELNTTHFHILTCADAFDDYGFKANSFIEVLLKFILMTEGKGSDVNFTQDELDFIISKLKEKYAQVNKKNV